MQDLKKNDNSSQLMISLILIQIPKVFSRTFYGEKKMILESWKKLGQLQNGMKKKGSNIIIISKTSFLLLSTIKEGHKKVDY